MITPVVPVQYRFHHVSGRQWGQTRNAKNSGGEVFEALTGLFVNRRQIKDGGESSGRKGNVIVSRNSKAAGGGKSRSTEGVKYKSPNRESSSDFLKRLEKIRSVESKKLKEVGHAAKRYQEMKIG